MNFSRVFAVVITLGVLSTASSQETQKSDSPPAAKPAGDASAPGSQAPNGAGNGAQAPVGPASSAQSPPPPPSAATGKTGVIKDNEFIPTEEIQPDEAVTFPVDI